MAHFRHTQPTEIEIERQIRFELRCVEDGAQKVRDSLLKEGLGGSRIGMKLMRKVMKPLVQEIGRSQTEAFEKTMEGKRGRAPHWWTLVNVIDKHKLGVIIMNSVFNAKPRDGTSAYPVSRVALAISNGVYQQIDYDTWEADQKELKKETGEFTDLDRLNLSAKNLDQKIWKRFREKIDRVKLEKWTHEQGITFGVKCLDFLVTAKPDWFEIATKPIQGGRWETQLILSEECRDVMFDMIEQEELTSPRLLPTLIPPAPWRKAA
jgi:hypothetical protein